MTSKSVACSPLPADQIDVSALESAAFRRVFPAEETPTTTITGMSEALKARFERRGREGADPLTPPTITGPALDRLVNAIQANFSHILAIKKSADERLAQLTNEGKELSKIIREEHRAPTEKELSVLDEIRKEIDEVNKKFIAPDGQERDFYYAVQQEVLRSFGAQLRLGRIAEVPFTNAVIGKIIEQLTLGEPVFIHGDTGSGKTESAKVAAKRFSGKDPILVRCYPGMAQEEVFGHITLKSDGLDRAAEVVSRISQEILHWKNHNAGASIIETAKAENQITTKLLTENRLTVLDYVLGAQYLAMKEGRIVIYDEANAMPPQLRRKLNDIKTKRVGESVTIQEDGGTVVSVAPGYGMIETANLGKRYGEGVNGRFSYTPDEHDRRQAYIECGYLPQAVKGSYTDVVEPKNKQLFMIALAALIDSSGNIVAPHGTLQKVWTLSQYAALTQQAFSETISDDNLFAQGGGVKVRIRTDVLISPRGLQSILHAWRSDGYRCELDHYLAENLLSRTTDPNQRAYLYQLGQTCGLFTSRDWPTHSFPAGKIPQFSVESPKNLSSPLDFIQFTEVVEAIWGKAPARSMLKDRQPDSAMIPEEQRIQIMKSLAEALKQLEGVVGLDEAKAGPTPKKKKGKK